MQNRPSPAWSIKICGYRGLPVSVADDAVSDKDWRRLKASLGIAAEAVTSFHFSGKPCWMMRPMAELQRMWTPGMLIRRSVAIHIVRQLSPESDASPRLEIVSGRSKAHPPDWTMRRTDMQVTLQPVGAAIRTVEDPRSDDMTCAFETLWELESTKSYLDHVVWTPSNVEVELTSSLDALTAEVKEKLRHRLARDRNLYRRLRHDHRVVTFGIWIPISARLGEVNVQQSSLAGRIAAVGDLFEELQSNTWNSASLRRTARVTLRLDHVADSRQYTKEDRSKKRSSETADLRPHVHAYGEPQYTRCIRLGESQRVANRDSDDIKQEYALIATLDDTKQTIVSLLHVPYFEIGGLCIGDISGGDNVDFHDRSEWRWHNDFARIKDRQELRKRIFAPTDGDPRLPTLPALSFNTFDPSVFTPQLGAVVHDADIHLAIRYVNHLEDYGA